MSRQVAYRLGDGSPVTLDSARAIWAAVAREVLASAAGAVTHSELARLVQQRSGIYTRMPTSEWLPTVVADLGDVELTSRLRADAPPVASRTRTTTAPRRPRAEPARPKRQDAPPAICPTCFMQLPASGRCDTCG